MTNEEAIELIKVAQAEVEWSCPMDYVVAFDLAIKALEQTDVLDKIRAEIMDFEEELFHRPNTDYADYAAVRHCVEIIDKYKVERSDKDADSD